MGIAVFGLKMGHQTSDGWRNRPNSAGGVSVEGYYQNTGTKTIKYISLRFTPYNAVGDAVGCSIRNVSNFGVKCTGPINPNESKSFFGENLWYNHSITSISFTNAIVQYMDGTEEDIAASELSPPVSKGGCYIATSVYGSYDCPELWTLRRYRDNVLARTYLGRSLIHYYYLISPTLIKWFGKTRWFNAIWKVTLDRMVSKLQISGVESLPYEDRIL